MGDLVEIDEKGQVGVNIFLAICKNHVELRDVSYWKTYSRQAQQPLSWYMTRWSGHCLVLVMSRMHVLTSERDGALSR